MRRLVVSGLLLGVAIAACQPHGSRKDTIDALRSRMGAMRATAAGADATAAQLVDLARLEWKVGEYDDAEATYRRALAPKRDPATAEELARLLEQRGRYQAAVTLVRDYGIQRASSDDSWLADLLRWSDEDHARPGPNLSTALGIEFVSVPDGRWVRGRDDGPADQRPQREVRVKGFRIGKFEVTAGQYQQFLKLSGYRSRNEPYAWLSDPTRQAHPAAGISWEDAKAFTVWLSLRDAGVYRLPTEAEWEWAARGPSGGSNPWGRGGRTGVDGNWGRIAREELKARPPLTAAVGSHSRDRSPFGAFDMGGNVMEWCLDAYDATYYEWAPVADPFGPVEHAGEMVLRGWAYNHPGSPAGSTIDRASATRLRAYTGYGFRIVREE